MRRKIILSLFALFMVFTIGLVIASMYITSGTSELKHVIALHQVEQLRRNLVIDLQTVQLDLYTVKTPMARELDSVVDNVIRIEKTAGGCLSCHHLPGVLNRLENVQSLIQDYEDSLSYYITGSADLKRLEKFKTDAFSTGNKLLVLTEDMSHSASNRLEELSDSTMKGITNVRNILLVTVLITFVLGIMVAVNLTKSVTRPVRELVEATGRIASGEYGSIISYKDKTEFGELAVHFNTMSTAIKEGYEKIHNEVTERRQTEEALRKSEEKLQSVFNHMQDFFYRTDREGRISWVSPSATQLIGCKSTDELTGRNFTEFCAPPEKRQLFLEELFQKHTVTDYEMDLLRIDGNRITVSANAHFYFDKDGEVEGIQGVYRDITARKRLEEEYLKVEKLESLGILAGGIAHDFSNILTAILGNISLAKDAALSENEISILKDAEKAGIHARELIRQLLTFSKGGVPIKKTASVAELLQDSASFVLRGSRVKCEYAISDALWPVEIDEGQIHQVINNLVINANQAMPGGGILRIKAENVTLGEDSTLPLKSGNYIKISFRDQGTGIAKEDLEKIFDPYFTTKKSGSGLGLATTYFIIKKHGGHIEVKSEKGTGTTFCIYLPVSRNTLPVMNEKTHKVLRGKGRILLMDDEALIQKTVSGMLKQLGYETRVADNGDDAIMEFMKAMRDSVPFDAVLIDLTVRGGKGGIETVQELLKIDPDVKAIVSSGYYNDPVMADYQNYGFRDVIAKPYSLEELSRLLHRVIHGKN